MGMFKNFAKDKVAEEQERKRQEDLEKELAAQRLEMHPNMEEIEPPEPDSDEVNSDEWPDPRPERQILADEDMCEEILNGL